MTLVYISNNNEFNDNTLDISIYNKKIIMDRAR